MKFAAFSRNLMKPIIL